MVSVRSHRPAQLDMGQIQRTSEPQTSKGSPELRNPWRTTSGTTPTLPEKSRGESQWNHPAATVQKPQGAAATSPQAPPGAVYARADQAMGRETRDPTTYHSPNRGPGKGREGLGGKMLSQGASSPADPNRHPRSPSSNKGWRHRHIQWAKGSGQARAEFIFGRSM
ncbi:hypothetical protein AMECASPLE_030995 [Ameca splendens]|uniref:Uncharacterized protein n=1 Tax=Ameca splendens TaxID=208324 RepID=A0ABV1A1L0_9TELE